MAVVRAGDTIPATPGLAMLGASDGTAARAFSVDANGKLKILVHDGSGNALTSTSGAVDVNIKTSSINVPVSIAANSLGVVQVGPTSAANTLSNPFFNRISDADNNSALVRKNTAPAATQGLFPFGVFDGTNLQYAAGDSSGRLKTLTLDGSGNAITSTGGFLQHDIASQTLTALKVSATAAANTAANPIFVAPVVGGVALTATSNALDVNLKSNGVTALPVSATTALNTSANPLFSRLTDGTTNTVVKAASTAPVAADPALVVSVSPNSSVTTTNASVSATAAAVPASATMVGGTDGTNLRALSVDTAGRLKVLVNDGSGNALTSTGNALDVNLKTNGVTALPVSATTALNTATNPIFATVRLGDSAGTAITLSGANLKASLFDSTGVAAVVLDGAAVGASRSIVLSGGTDGTNLRALAVDTSGRIKTLTLDGSGNAVTSTGGFLQQDIASQTLTALKVSATSSANAAANPIFVAPVVGGVALTATSNALDVNLKSNGVTALPVSATTALNTSANPLFARLTDGTTGTVVKAASTAPVAADPALVVSISPNSSLTATNPSVGATAAAVPASATQVGGTDGTLLRALATDTSGRLKTLSLDGSGTALTSTGAALDVNLKTSSITVAVDVTAQTLTALKVSATSAANTLANPIFNRLSDADGNSVLVRKNTAPAATQGALPSGVFDGTNMQLLAGDPSGIVSMKLKDGDNNNVAIRAGTALNTNQGGMFVAGTDGTNSRIMAVSTAGLVRVELATQTLTAVSVSKNASANAVNNAIFVQPSDGTNSATGTAGSAAPTGMVMTGGTDGTNARTLAVSTTGHPKSDTFDGSGTAITSLTGPTGVQGLDVAVRTFVAIPGDHVYTTNSVTTTATTANQTVLSYTVPAGKDFFLVGFSLEKSVSSGTVEMQPARLRVAGTDIAVKTTEAAPRSWQRDIGFPGVKVATAAQVITMTVTPSGAGSNTWFGTLVGYLRST